MLNNVCLCGRLVKECTLMQVGKDAVKTRFTIAVNRDYKDKTTGKYPCDFIDCEVWNAGANYLEQYANKGDTLTVSGAIRKDSWESAEGDRRTYVYIAVNTVNIVARVEPEEEDEPEDRKPARRGRR